MSSSHSSLGRVTAASGKANQVLVSPSSTIFPEPVELLIAPVASLAHSGSAPDQPEAVLPRFYGLIVRGPVGPLRRVRRIGAVGTNGQEKAEDFKSEKDEADRNCRRPSVTQFGLCLRQAPEIYDVPRPSLDCSVILLCVRWYLAYNLSLRNWKRSWLSEGSQSTTRRCIAGSSGTHPTVDAVQSAKSNVIAKWHGRPERIVIDGSQTSREAILSCETVDRLQRRLQALS